MLARPGTSLAFNHVGIQASSTSSSPPLRRVPSTASNVTPPAVEVGCWGMNQGFRCEGGGLFSSGGARCEKTTAAHRRQPLQLQLRSKSSASRQKRAAYALAGEFRARRCVVCEERLQLKRVGGAALQRRDGKTARRLDGSTCALGGRAPRDREAIPVHLPVAAAAD